MDFVIVDKQIAICSFDNVGKDYTAYGYCQDLYIPSYNPIPTPSYSSNGMSAVGITFLTIACVLFLIILPIVFCILKAKGRAKRSEVV